jgi:hypothetical protein
MLHHSNEAIIEITAEMIKEYKTRLESALESLVNVPEGTLEQKLNSLFPWFPDGQPIKLLPNAGAIANKPELADWYNAYIRLNPELYYEGTAYYATCNITNVENKEFYYFLPTDVNTGEPVLWLVEYDTDYFVLPAPSIAADWGLDDRCQWDDMPF